MNKNPILALFLSCIPGMGHIYLDKKVKGFIYGMLFFGPILLGFALFAASNTDDYMVLSLVSIPVWVINMFDMVISLIKGNPMPNRTGIENEGNDATLAKQGEQDKIFVVLLSFLPGLGHLYLGLMNRGITFLISFFGLGTMIVFITVLTHKSEFIIFLGVLPILWIYALVDGIRLYNLKQQGVELEDKTILEDLEHFQDKGKKSKTFAIFLSIFPGAGHLYLGLQRRGLQLMAVFLFSIYILDVLRLSIFLFLIPLIWFYSFFDGMQKASRHSDEPLEDTPVVAYLLNKQKWIGIGLIVLGLYYLVDRMVIPAFQPYIMEYFAVDLYHWYHGYFQTFIVSVLLIGGGLRLMAGSKKSKKEKGESIS